MPLKKSSEKVKVEVVDIKKKDEMQSDPEANTVNVLRGFASLCDSETEDSSAANEMSKSVCSDASEDKTFLTIFSTWDLPELNSYNVLNWFSFVLNVAVSFLIGQFGFFGCTPLRVQNETFRVLLSPVSWSFYAWALVYTLEGFFVLVQLHSKSEMNRIVRSIKFWFTGACLAHSCYTVFFSLGNLWLSTASSGICWVCLSWIIVKHHISEKKTLLEKSSLLMLGISLHAGWMTYTFILSINILLVNLYTGVLIQLVVTLISLVLLYTISGCWLILPKFPNFTVPLMIAWGYFGLSAELSNGVVRRLALEFDYYVLDSLKYVSWALCMIILVFCLFRLIMVFYVATKERKKEIQRRKIKNEHDIQNEKYRVQESSISFLDRNDAIIIS